MALLSAVVAAAAAACVEQNGSGGDSRPSPGARPPPRGIHAPIPPGVAPPTAASGDRRPPLDPASLAPGRALPARYGDVVPRVGAALSDRFSNLLYEGNNLVLRGPPGPGGIRQLDGDAIASRWRAFARGARGVFVLRDSLFSQQDHPYEHAPYAFMMPPSWVTSALADLEAHRRIVPPRTAPPEDDAAWTAVTSPEALFGTFPASTRMFELAVRPLDGLGDADRVLTLDARLTVSTLAADATAMARASAQGPDAVARAGADRIAASDVAYFGAQLRRERVIAIFVENPTRHEYEDEGKGMSVAGRDDVTAAAITRARNAVYARRLRDGDLALERYDISRASERARAIRVLEAIVAPGAPPGGNVWLWVNGGLEADGTRGNDPTPYLSEFRQELASAAIDGSRVRLFGKPSVTLPSGSARRSAFEAAVDHYHAVDLPLSLNLDTRALRALLAAPP